MNDSKTKWAVIFMTALLLLLVTRLALPNKTEEELQNTTASIESMGQKTILSESAKPEKTTPYYEDLFPNLYASGGDLPVSLPEKEKIVYLTFDDGPSERTKEVLKTLQEKKVHATFFVVGQDLVDSNKVLLNQIIEEGHTLGLHTYSHDYKNIYASVEAYLKDFDKVYSAISEITGTKPYLFRFPGGSNNSFVKNLRKPLIAEMKRRGFIYFDWNVSAEDAVGNPTKSSIRGHVLDALRFSYPVILMHDGQANHLTADVLPELIDTLKKAGYRFDTLDHRTPLQF